ncbi:MAG: hypothetical protein AB1476_02900 [Candidatus Hadarchaeota archaeon]
MPDYGDKYYLRIGKREDLLKLREVGIAMATHQQRLESVCNSYKAAAWEIALVASNEFSRNFTSGELASILKISKESTLWRIRELIRRGLLIKNQSFHTTYSVTELGKELASRLSAAVKIQPLRTNPHENEMKVKTAIKIGLKTKHDIARYTGLTTRTVLEVLARINGGKRLRFIAGRGERLA